MKHRTMSIVGAVVVIVTSGAVGVASADQAERRADVRLVATMAGDTVTLDYSNPGNVAKETADVFAEIPVGVTVTATPAPGWECQQAATLVCSTTTTLHPGEVQHPATVVLTATASADVEFGTLGFYRDPTENPADNYSTVTVTP